MSPPKHICMNIPAAVSKSRGMVPDSSTQAVEGFGGTGKAAELATKSAVPDGFCDPRGCRVLLLNKLLFGQVGSKRDMGEIIEVTV